MKRVAGCALFAAGLVLSAVGVSAEESWPQWGGPERRAVAPGEGLFGETVALDELWRREVPGGISAPVVAGGKVFSLASDDLEDYAFALDAGSGEELWRLDLGQREKELSFGAASTPASDGEALYLLAPDCRLMAVAATDGRVLWSRALKEDYETGAMRSGCWTSPLLSGRFLVVQVNGEPDKRLVAFDKATGEELWSAAGTGRSVRASPALLHLGGRGQVVVHERNREGRGGLYAVALDDGSPLWTHRFEGAESYGYDTPLAVGGDRLAVVTWNDFRLVALGDAESGTEARDLWTSPEVRAEVQPYNLRVVHHGGHFYGFGGDDLVALDAHDATVRWRQKTYPGSLVLADGHLVVLSQAAGLLRVVEATPEAYREKARLEVFAPGAPTDTPPSIADGRIYLRNSEEMVALAIEGASDERSASQGTTGAER